MRFVRILSFVLIALVAIACNSTLDREFKKETAEKDVKEILESGDADSADLKLMGQYLARHFPSLKKMEGKTYAEIIDSAKAWDVVRQAEAKIELKKREEFYEAMAKLEETKQKRFNAFTEEEKTEILKNFRKKRDDFAGRTFYEHVNTPRYTNVNGMYLYIGIKDGELPYLRFRIQYAADTWLFISAYQIKADDKMFDFKPDDVDTDYSGGRTYEWCDIGPEYEHMDMLKAVAAAKSVTIRHRSSKYYSDRTMSPKELAAFTESLRAYEQLVGTLEIARVYDELNED